MALRNWLVAFAAVCAATAGAAEQYVDDVTMEDYLRGLEQVSIPAARDGAVAFMDAYRAKCQRAMTTVELRRAFAEGDGDPILKGMIAAAYYRDAAATRSLAGQVTCRGRAR